MLARRTWIAAVQRLAVLFLIPFLYINFREHFGTKQADVGVGISINTWINHLCPKYSLINTVNKTLNWRPLTPNTIFFTETSCALKFSPRKACAVESAAHHHPHRPVLLLVTAPAILHPQPLLQLVEDLDNVEFSYLDLDQVFSEPPLKSWHHQRLWLYNEDHAPVFVSDAARVELLRRYGGTYLDLDIWTLRPLPDFQPYLGWQTAESVNNDVLSFSPRHHFIQEIVDAIPSVFNPHTRNTIGPTLFTTHLRQLCPEQLTIPKDINSTVKDTCHGITIYPRRAFSPISLGPSELLSVFLRGHGLGTKFLKESTDFYLLHLYNYLSEMLLVKLGGDSILEEVAKRNCPILLLL
nr:alpha-1,4-N-acetylglucosaminyltransferase-like [Cherax quadricarinatus]